MSRMQPAHAALHNGVGKCSVPMWSYGCPDGFCDREAYGFRPPPKRQYWHAHQGMYVRDDNLYDGYVPGLACHAHGGPASPDLSALTPFLDGDAWCCLLGANLQEGEAGFGATPEDAREALRVALTTT